MFGRSLVFGFYSLGWLFLEGHASLYPGYTNLGEVSGVVFLDILVEDKPTFF